MHYSPPSRIGRETAFLTKGSNTLGYKQASWYKEGREEGAEPWTSLADCKILLVPPTLHKSTANSAAWYLWSNKRGRVQEPCFAELSWAHPLVYPTLYSTHLIVWCCSSGGIVLSLDVITCSVLSWVQSHLERNSRGRSLPTTYSPHPYPHSHLLPPWGYVLFWVADDSFPGGRLASRIYCLSE